MHTRNPEQLVPQHELDTLADLRHVEPGGGLLLTVDLGPEDNLAYNNQVILNRTPGMRNYFENIAAGWELVRIIHDDQGNSQYYLSTPITLLSSPEQIGSRQPESRQDPKISLFEHLTYESFPARPSNPISWATQRRIAFTPKVLGVNIIAAHDWQRFMGVPKKEPFLERQTGAQVVGLVDLWDAFKSERSVSS